VLSEASLKIYCHVMVGFSKKCNKLKFPELNIELDLFFSNREFCIFVSHLSTYFFVITVFVSNSTTMNIQ